MDFNVKEGSLDELVQAIETDNSLLDYQADDVKTLSKEIMSRPDVWNEDPDIHEISDRLSQAHEKVVDKALASNRPYAAYLFWQAQKNYLPESDDAPETVAAHQQKLKTIANAFGDNRQPDLALSCMESYLEKQRPRSHRDTAAQENYQAEKEAAAPQRLQWLQQSLGGTDVAMEQKIQKLCHYGMEFPKETPERQAVMAMIDRTLTDVAHSDNTFQHKEGVKRLLGIKIADAGEETEAGQRAVKAYDAFNREAAMEVATLFAENDFVAAKPPLPPPPAIKNNSPMTAM